MSKLQALLDKSRASVTDAGKRLPKAAMECGGPSRSGEFRRIMNLPARPAAMEDEELRVLVTGWLRLPSEKLTGCPVCGRAECTDPIELRDAQSRAIAECVDQGGGLCQLGVGAGKTLTAILIATAFQSEHNVQRAGILVPSKLVAPFKRAVVAARRHWRVPKNLEDHVIGYGRLSLAGNEDMLVKMGVGLLICDEAHSLRERKSARTRRFLRLYKEFSGTKFVGLSGTFVKQSPLDYWHLAKLALGEDKSPLPKSWPEMQDWSMVVAPEEGLKPPAPGCIQELGLPGDTPPAAFARRVLSTYGIVSTRQASVDASIRASILLHPLPNDISDAIDNVLDDWEIPGGHIITEASGMHRAVSQLCLGFWSRLHFPIEAGPAWPEDWRSARRNWGRFCRESYRKHSLKLDSELAVANAVDAGRLEDPTDSLANWRAMKADPAKQPWNVTEWINRDHVCNVADKWLGKNGGLIWTHWIPAGERISEALGIPYYGGGTDPEADAPFKSAVLSVQAHHEGRNLQFINRNLALTMTPKAAVWQQLIGRTHRQGQRAPEVSIDFYAPCELTLAKVDEARRDALWLATQNVEPQKLCMADWEE